ncbi:hypothetical protein GCM10010218_40950 [Streptomyces mashuensis]|uniref:Uncharacterized protein n=1 Tax=Streptomyces mashuensis TaxID=33904 RepID=A0A919B4X1_9ACTN|nr:hypothetical protein [Streptomyces mashuensis]GHF55296.1 hypothetical protein GCM10010218_40950 [Streptomyces mashuensis]
MAVWSFLTGLTGLLVFNVVLGPCALALGTGALVRNTRRRFRAWLGIALGAAGLLLFVGLSWAQHTPSWSLED